ARVARASDADTTVAKETSVVEAITPKKTMAAEPKNPASLPVGDRAIAIIGMAGRYPDAPDLETFWQNLAGSKDSIIEIPASRWDWHAYFDTEKGTPGKSYSKWGSFLEDIDKFDPLFFNISPRD